MNIEMHFHKVFDSFVQCTARQREIFPPQWDGDDDIGG